jgi:hypothetical protein
MVSTQHQRNKRRSVLSQTRHHSSSDHLRSVVPFSSFSAHFGPLFLDTTSDFNRTDSLTQRHFVLCISQRKLKTRPHDFFWWRVCTAAPFIFACKVCRSPHKEFQKCLFVKVNDYYRQHKVACNFFRVSVPPQFRSGSSW